MRIRRVDIQNYRGIKRLIWLASVLINASIGPPSPLSTRRYPWHFKARINALLQHHPPQGLDFVEVHHAEVIKTPDVARRSGPTPGSGVLFSALA